MFLHLTINDKSHHVPHLDINIINLLSTLIYTISLVKNIFSELNFSNIFLLDHPHKLILIIAITKKKKKNV
jgi:hypothetical protein